MALWQGRKQRLAVAGAAGTILLGGTAWLWSAYGAHPARLAAKPAYTASGLGRTGAAPVAPGRMTAFISAFGTTDPTLQAAQQLYDRGNYAQAEAAAEQIIRSNAGAADIPHRRQVVKAREVLAYSAARRKDLPLARERFSDLQKAAAELPDHGKPAPVLGENPPALDEDAAYQHATLTAALGDKKGAEGEYVALMKRYPESPLVQGAIKRIAWMHGGNIPKEDEAVWQGVMKTAQERQRARDRESSLCGPECLAELLREKRDGGMEGWKGGGEKQGGREGQLTIDNGQLTMKNGKSVDGRARDLVHELAGEMGTDEGGTTMEGLAETARRHGIAARGLALTMKGLQEQKLPMIALIEPGHYVLVERVGPGGVTLWDPDAEGVGKPAVREVPTARWEQVWSGKALVG